VTAGLARDAPDGMRPESARRVASEQNSWRALWPRIRIPGGAGPALAAHSKDGSAPGRTPTLSATGTQDGRVGFNSEKASRLSEPARCRTGNVVSIQRRRHRASKSFWPEWPGGRSGRGVCSGAAPGCAGGHGRNLPRVWLAPRPALDGPTRPDGRRLWRHLVRTFSSTGIASVRPDPLGDGSSRWLDRLAGIVGVAILLVSDAINRAYMGALLWCEVPR
jgi:hypothetical protein